MENTALGKISAKQTPESLRIEALEAEIEAINDEMEEKVMAAQPACARVAC